MSRNAVICYLTGTAEPLPPDVVRSVRAEPDGALLFTLYCARADDVDDFAGALAALEPAQLRFVSSYCLMLGLSGRVQAAFILFDALKSRGSDCAAVWLDLARLQTAWDYLLPALRSEAMYRKLCGEGAGAAPAPRLLMARSDPGPIHILDGDLPSVRRF